MTDKDLIREVTYFSSMGMSVDEICACIDGVSENQIRRILKSTERRDASKHGK